MTHPANAGNKARVLDLCDSLKNKGFDLYFFYIYKDALTDTSETIRYFGEDNFFCYQSKHINFRKLFTPLFYFLSKLNVVRPDQVFNYSVDYWFDKGIFNKLQLIINDHDFKSVIIEYVFYSKCFDIIDSEVLKVIDTHDSYSDRWRIFYDLGIVPFGLSTYVKEESKGLNRADLNIAIQAREKEYFQSISHKKVITYGKKLQRPYIEQDQTNNNILYIGGDHKLNNYGISSFIKHSLPKVIEQCSDAKLIIAGSICNYIVKHFSNHPNIELLGSIKSKEEFYNKGTISINPMPSGTGLKIKSIEAIEFSKYLVTTSSGAEGIVEIENDVCLLANSPKEFAQHIISIIRSPVVKNDLKQHMISFHKKWHKDFNYNLNVLIDSINEK